MAGITQGNSASREAKGVEAGRPRPSCDQHGSVLKCSIDSCPNGAARLCNSCGEVYCAEHSTVQRREGSTVIAYQCIFCSLETRKPRKWLWVIAVFAVVVLSIASISSRTHSTLFAAGSVAQPAVSESSATPGPTTRELPAPAVSLATDPLDGSIVYALLETNVLYRSDDEGQTWQQVTLPIDERPFTSPSNTDMRNSVFLLPQQAVVVTSGNSDRQSLLVTPSDPKRRIFAPGSLIRSDNKGSTWQRIWDGGSVWAPADPQGKTLFAWQANVLLREESGIFRSDDGGMTWQQVYAGYFPPSIQFRANHEGITNLLVDPTNPNILYAGTDFGIFRSTDGGRIWQGFNDGLPPTTHTYRWVPLMAAGVDGAVYAVVEVVEDPRGPMLATLVRLRPGEEAWVPVGGATWRSGMDPTEGFGGFQTLVADPFTPRHFYAGTNRGLLISEDAGENWQRVEIPGVKAVFRIAVGRGNSPDAPSTLYMWTDAGFVAWQKPLNKINDDER